jgi:hypothetical protein
MADMGLCLVCILFQSYCYYYAIQDSECEDDVYEQSCQDGIIHSNR